MTGAKKKTYLVLMAIGALALMVDRLFLDGGAPAPASAEESDESHDFPMTPQDPVSLAAPPSRHSPKPRSGPGEETISIPELAFPRELKPLDADAPIRDLFARAAIVPPDEPVSTGDPSTGAKSGDRTVFGRNAFATRHRLDAIMSGEGLKILILDGRWMREGEVVDGCTLIAIEKEKAVFRCRDGETELSLAARITRPNR